MLVFLAFRQGRGGFIGVFRRSFQTVLQILGFDTPVYIFEIWKFNKALKAVFKFGSLKDSCFLANSFIISTQGHKNYDIKKL